MKAHPAHGLTLKARFARSFLLRRLVHVNLQILYDCNYRCGICDFWKPPWQHQPRLSARDVETIAAKLNAIGPQIVSIGGGEPLLHPELPAIVRALARWHFPVMITNGSRMTPALARELFAAGMVEISVSVDYDDPARHDAQRAHPGAHAAALEALRVLHENRTHPAQRVNMISVVLDDNLPDIEPLIRRCGEMGITYLVTLYSHGRGAKPFRAPAPELSLRLLELKRRYRNFVALRGYLSRFSEASVVGGIGGCQAGRSLCNIDSRGLVSACIDRLGAPAGNILTDDIGDIVRRLREQQRTSDCRACWTSCRGSIESVRGGRQRLRSLIDYHGMTRPVPLGGRF
jgi:MoaA/NifB/PqqE/SkfB family radical SAM enzyme